MTGLALLVLDCLVAAQGARPGESGLEPGPSVDHATSVLTTFQGFVLEPSGAPAEGARVVSSAGGQAITSPSGSYRLAAPLPLEARSVQITATCRGGKNLVASTTVRLSPGAGVVRVDPLQLVQAGPCSAGWQPTFGGQPGMDWDVKALTEFDDGSGPALHAGGFFWTAGGVVANGIAKWDGSAWSALGSGTSGTVNALVVYDDGGGPALYAGGSFTTAGGVPASNIARWDGSTWTALGSGTSGSVGALAVYDDGGGPALYAGGSFAIAGGVAASNIAKWDGSSWSALGSGTNGSVGALAVYDGGSGPALYAGGAFAVAGGVVVNHVAKWDGSAWEALGGGLRSLDRGTPNFVLHATPGIASVRALAVFDDGRGPALFVSGDFHRAGTTAARNIARWDGSNWEAVGGGTRGVAHALAVYDDGQGQALYAGGDIRFAGGLPVKNVVKWDGSSWSALGTGTEFDLSYPSTYYAPVFALAVHDEGSGAVLCAGGQFSRAGGVPASMIARWDGAGWSALGTGINSSLGRYNVLGDYFPIATLAVHDDGGGPALYAGGQFTTAGGVALNHVAKWDGSGWSPLGGGLGTHSFYPVLALTSFDDGSGPALYAGGNGSSYKWDGSSWIALGLGGWVKALAVYDDGTGSALHAGGTFYPAPNHVARWNGSSWTTVGSGLSSYVNAMTVWDDGSGPALFAGGHFLSAGGTPVSRVAKWNGALWSALGSGVTTTTTPSFCTVNALVAFDDGTGPALFVGGDFTSAGGVTASNIAKWDGSTWAALTSGTNACVRALAVHDDGSGPALYVGGDFTLAGGVAANRIARWDGTSWSALGSGMSNKVATFAVHDDGSGPALFAGGSFGSAIDSADSYLAKWGCGP